MTISKLLLSTSVATSLLLSGCGTLSLETNVKMTKSVWLKPTKKDKATIFISLKNISEENLDILPLLKQRLEKKNFILVDSANNANYVMMINILFANNLKEAADIQTAGKLGVATGVISAAGNSSSGDSLLVGASIALASGLVSAALADETYRAVVDVVIDEKSKDPRHNNTLESVESSDSIMGAGFKEHKTRVLAEAVQTNLKLAEALPILSKEVAKQLSNIF